METGLKAFFYDYKYYLLPDGCESVGEVKKLKSTEVRRLKEEGCMAPDFIYDSIATEFLVIEDSRRVFPAEINLYEKREYDALLLKQVKKRCPGCRRYTDDGTDELNGHHKEMSLSGACYLRENESEENGDFAYPLGRYAVGFWEIIAEKANELASLTDKGDQKAINKLVNKILEKFFLPLDIFCGVENGQYCLCMSSHEYGFSGMRAIVAMLAETASRKGSAMEAVGWKVYPYFPKGVYAPSLRPDYVKNPPRIFYGADGHGGTELCIFEKGADSWNERTANGRKTALYKYLCREIGENVLLAGAASLTVTEKIPGDKTATCASELAEILTAGAKEIYEGRIPFPAPVFWETKGLIKDALPYKQSTVAWTTICEELTPEKFDGETAVDNAVFEALGAVYAYIYLPEPSSDMRDSEKYEILEWYFSHREGYPEPIYNSEDWELFMKQVGMTFSPDGVCIDFMIFDEKEFFRFMRNLAPVLEGLHAKIVTVKRSGEIVYNPGYIFLPEDSGLRS